MVIGPRRRAPAAERNAEPIRAVLARVLPARGLVLEVASGSGQHAVFMATAFPAITWQPTDADPAALASIQAWGDEASLFNLRPPLRLDAEDEPEAWPIAAADAVVCINMIHIAPWSATLGLLRGAAALLGPGAPLITYGPYRVGGATAPSNQEFDASLRARDPAWGVREVRDLEAAAAAVGLHLVETAPMPANNHTLVFRRSPAPPEESR